MEILKITQVFHYLIQTNDMLVNLPSLFPGFSFRTHLFSEMMSAKFQFIRKLENSFNDFLTPTNVAAHG